MVATVIAINSIEDDAIVRVNKLKISDALFKSKYKQFLNDNYLADNMLNRYALMNSLIDSLLILNHAEEIGLYKNPSLIKDGKDAYDQLLLNEFFESVITIEKDIDEEELKFLSGRIQPSEFAIYSHIILIKWIVSLLG